MIATFGDLCKEQQINSLNPSEVDLKKLVDWCEKMISTDLSFQGNIQERFKAYESLVSGFLEIFRPQIEADKLTEPVVFFEDMTPLQVIVDTGLNKYLQMLHPSFEQVSSKINGITLLHIAAARGHFHTIEVLLSLGVNPLDKSSKGEPILFTSLMLPMAHDERMIKNKQAIYVLLSNLANSLLHERNQSGDAILHTMSVYGYKKLIDDTLADRQEFASIPNNARRYPIHVAILNMQHACVKVLAAVPGVEQLIDAKGRNALHYAAKYGDNNMVNICLNSAISKDSIDIRRQTPLILATVAKNPSAFRELIDFGVQVNLIDDVNRSALHYAVEANDIDFVQLLLAAPGIDVNLSDDNAKNPLDLIQAGTSIGKKISHLLIDKGATHCQIINSSK